MGCTENVQQRILDHNQKRSPYTSTGVPWIVKYSEKFETLSEARKRELQIKNKKSRKYIEYLIHSSAG